MGLGLHVGGSTIQISMTEDLKGLFQSHFLAILCDPFWDAKVTLWKVVGDLQPGDKKRQFESSGCITFRILLGGTPHHAGSSPPVMTDFRQFAMVTG